MKTEKAFTMRQKAFFISFKELFVGKNCLRSASATLIDQALSRQNDWLLLSTNFTEKCEMVFALAEEIASQ